MKKWIVLLLAAVMCLSLAACGGDAPNTNDNGTEQSNGNDTVDNPYQDHPVLQFLYGEWEYVGDHQSNYPFAKLNVNEDGTCFVDGTAGTWTISTDTYDGCLYIDVLVDDRKIGTAKMSLWAGKYDFGVANIAINPGDGWKHNTAVVADDNDIVLTTENWRNYFDLITEAHYSENAFGEVETLILEQYLVAKEEYAANILATDVVYEITKTYTRYDIRIDAAEKSYTLGEVIGTSESTSSKIGNLWREYESNQYIIEIFSVNINAAENADPDNIFSKNVELVSDIENIEMLRVQGNIYIVNE